MRLRFKYGRSMSVLSERQRWQCYLCNSIFDDILIIAKSFAGCQMVVRTLEGDFTLSELGPAHLFLGIAIRRCRKLGIMDFSQVSFIKKMLNRFNLANHPKKVPI